MFLDSYEKIRQQLYMYNTLYIYAYVDRNLSKVSIRNRNEVRFKQVSRADSIVLYHVKRSMTKD